MRNLEIKLKLDRHPQNLVRYFTCTLWQTDTYFSCPPCGSQPTGRFKLREEVGEKPYFIRYFRSNTENEKISTYEVYELSEMQLKDFFTVFGFLLHEEIKVVKKRDLYMFKNARIHIDDVEGLGLFMEIEVVITTEEEEKNSQQLLKDILKFTSTEDCQKVDVGYRELLLQKLDEEKSLDYYLKNPKMFWVVNTDVCDRGLPGHPLAKANDIVPCLFTDENDGEYRILQLDPSMGKDGNRYTMWRKLVGKEYKVNCQVLLLVDGEARTLKGEKVSPEKISRSDVHVHRSFLARFA
jgi:predicted adenylyl cyclase CyaB